MRMPGGAGEIEYVRVKAAGSGAEGAETGWDAKHPRLVAGEGGREGGVGWGWGLESGWVDLAGEGTGAMGGTMTWDAAPPRWVGREGGMGRQAAHSPGMGRRRG